MILKDLKVTPGSTTIKITGSASKDCYLYIVLGFGTPNFVNTKFI